MGLSEELSERTRMSAFVALAADARPYDLLVAATNLMVGLFGDRGTCVLLQGGPRVIFSTDSTTNDGARDQPPVDVERLLEIGGTLVTSGGLFVGDVATDPAMEPVRHFLPSRVRSLALIPLSAGDRKLGAFFVQAGNVRPRNPQAEEDALLAARLTAVLIDARTGGRLDLIGLDLIDGSPALTAGEAAAVASGGNAAVNDRPGKGRKILIVDDDPDQADALEDALTDEGYSVRRAADGAAGLRSVYQSPPDMVLMDVSMPVLDGTSAAQQMRQDPIACHVPIIFVSGSPDLLQRLRKLALEEMDFLPKPYVIDQLLLRMQRAFERVSARKRLREDANIDELTRLGNLRVLRERLGMEESRLERYGIPAAMVVLDVDKLKVLNDEHGHATGSEALRAIAGVLTAAVRDTDLAVRYGGDEFVVLLPHTSLKEGLVFAHRVLGQIRDLRPNGVHVTASLGVAAREEKTKSSFTSLLEHADAAVYQAKHQGGNQVCSHEERGGSDRLKRAG